MSKRMDYSKRTRRNQVVCARFENGCAVQHSRAISVGRKSLSKAELAEQLAAAVRATAEMEGSK